MLPAAPTASNAFRRSSERPLSAKSFANMTVRYSNLRKLNYQAHLRRSTVRSMNDILVEKDARVVEEILTRELDVRREQLTHDVCLVDDLGADSLTLVEITMALEDQFNISIPDERWEKVRTVGDLLEALAELLQEQRR